MKRARRLAATQKSSKAAVKDVESSCVKEADIFMSVHRGVSAKRPSRPIYSKVATNVHVKTNAHYRNVHLRVIEATAVRALNADRHIQDVKKVSDIGNPWLHLPFPCIFRDFFLAYSGTLSCA